MAAEFSALPNVSDLESTCTRTLVIHTVLEQTTLSSSAVGFNDSPFVRKADTGCCATSYGTCSFTIWNRVTGPSKYQDCEFLVFLHGQTMNDLVLIL